MNAEETPVPPGFLPSEYTLKKYGLEYKHWKQIWDYQGGACAICGRTGVKLQIDHRHVKQWKKLPDEERRKWVRGLLCWRENHKLLGAVRMGVTPDILRKAADYLEANA